MYRCNETKWNDVDIDAEMTIDVEQKRVFEFLNANTSIQRCPEPAVGAFPGKFLKAPAVSNLTPHNRDEALRVMMHSVWGSLSLSLSLSQWETKQNRVANKRLVKFGAPRGAATLSE